MDRVHSGLARSGLFLALLGDHIHQALMKGRIRRAEVRLLFEECFEEDGRPQEVYFDWVEHARRGL